ncbi:hypothetical protein [Kiloniella laminariae]|uniref:hypothetical protein n=1 Tax=Kiloniella laminariae TaxID=454162 RepID=UPI00036E4275|nr:hypothetical protein [Kiloniella laminariae]
MRTVFRAFFFLAILGLFICGLLWLTAESAQWRLGLSTVFEMIPKKIPETINGTTPSKFLISLGFPLLFIAMLIARARRGKRMKGGSFYNELGLPTARENQPEYFCDHTANSAEVRPPPPKPDQQEQINKNKIIFD